MTEKDIGKGTTGFWESCGASFIIVDTMPFELIGLEKIGETEYMESYTTQKGLNKKTGQRYWRIEGRRCL